MSDDDDDALGQREEEAAVELAADAPEVPRDAADDRAGQDREERDFGIGPDRAIPGGSDATAARRARSGGRRRCSAPGR